MSAIRILIEGFVVLSGGFIAGGMIFVHHYNHSLSYTCVPEDSASVLVEDEDYREMPALDESEKCFSTLRKTNE